MVNSDIYIAKNDAQNQVEQKFHLNEEVIEAMQE